MSSSATKLAPSASPIVYTIRSDLAAAVLQELAAIGQTQALKAASGDECITMLIQNPASVLVLDWDVGSMEVNRILGAIKGHFHVETRPIFLIIDEVVPAVIATGAEYGVSQIHAGPISHLSIRECLTSLYDEEQATQSIRSVLVQVADARARGDWALATPLLVSLWEKDPRQERIVTELAENLIHQGDWERALELLGPFADAEPPSIRAIHLMGRCLMQKGDMEAAITMLQRAKIINPHNVDRLIDLGNAFLGNDQISEAQGEFEQATAVDSGSKGAAVGRSQCLLLTGEVNEALSLLKSISGPREMASVFNTAAVLSMRAGRYNKGMMLYQSALKALGKDTNLASRLYFNMGLGYRRWSKPEKAVLCFERSLELDPTYAKAKRHMQTMSGARGDSKNLKDKAFAEEEFATAASPGRPVVSNDMMDLGSESEMPLNEEDGFGDKDEG